MSFLNFANLYSLVGSNKRRILLWLILLALFLFNVTTPFTEDVLVSFGSAFQADYLGDFPINVYKTFDLRGIGYRLLIYLLYRLSFSLTGATDTLLFQAVAKSIYYACFLSLAAWSMAQLRHLLAKYSIVWTDAFAIFALATLAVSHWMSLQAEEVANFMTLAMIALALSSRPLANFGAALFVPVLFSLKAITVGLALFPFALLLMDRPPIAPRLVRLFAGALAMIVIVLPVYLLLLPQEMGDIQNAMLFQDSLLYADVSLAQLPEIFLTNGLFFVNGAIRTWSHLPIFAVGCIVLGFLYFVGLVLRSRAALEATLLTTALFFTAYAMVLVQSQYFAYHYLPFVLPSLVAFFWLWQLLAGYRDNLVEVVLGAVLALFVVNVVLDVPLPFTDAYASRWTYEEEYYFPRAEMYRAADEKFNLSAAPSLLAFTDGTANYYLPAKSYLRYQFPLPLQRISSTERLSSSAVYRTVLQDVLAFEGQFIVLDLRWMAGALSPELVRKFESEYQVVHEADPFAPAIGPILVLKRRSE